MRNRYIATLSLTSAIYGGWVVNDAPRPLYPPPRERDSVPIVEKARCAPGRSWTGVANLPSTGIRSQDRQPVENRYTDWAVPALHLVRSGHIAALVTHLGTSCRWVVSLTPWALYSEVKSLRYHRGDRVGHRVGLDTLEKEKSHAPGRMLSLLCPAHGLVPVWGLVFMLSSIFRIPKS